MVTMFVFFEKNAGIQFMRKDGTVVPKSIAYHKIMSGQFLHRSLKPGWNTEGELIDLNKYEDYLQKVEFKI